MATNQMRREAAKRKLANQQKHRAERAQKRRQVAVISSAAAVVVIIVAVVLLTTRPWATDSTDTSDAAAAPTSTLLPAAPGTVNCDYLTETTAAKPNTPPNGQSVETTGTVDVALTTSSGPIGLTLDRAKAPCTVNNFISLASQQYFDGTSCHRLTTGEGLKVLQCGDPSGNGSGGPGYTIPDEKPTGLAPSPDDARYSIYPRGTVAMAKTAAPNSGGSQFFLVYEDSTLPPEYTVFGTIDNAGLATLDKIAKAGDDGSNGAGDGHPNTPVTITSAAAA